MRCLGAIFLAVGLAGGVSPAWGHHPGHEQKAERRAADRVAPPFQLTGHDGGRVSLSDLKGRLVLLTFIYTTCVDFCPLLTADMKRVLRHARDAGVEGLQLAFITTDPEVDSPKVLWAYANRYRVDLSAAVFLTGSAEELGSVWHAYGVKVKKRARGLVDHTLVTVLIDGRGRIRRQYLGGGLDAEAVVADIMRVGAPR